MYTDSGVDGFNSKDDITQKVWPSIILPNIVEVIVQKSEALAQH